MLPVGCGRPPAGSRLTANFLIWLTPGMSRSSRRPLCPWSSVNTPALIGLLGMIQSWEVLPAGRGGGVVGEENPPPGPGPPQTKARGAPPLSGPPQQALLGGGGGGGG